jgi:hypothetical protein
LDLPAPEDAGFAAPQLSIIAAHVDSVDEHGRVVGWAWVPSIPERRVDVKLYTGDELISCDTAVISRTDVLDAGYGDGQYGYALRLPERLLDGWVHSLSLRFDAPGAEPLAIQTELKLPQHTVHHLDGAAQANRPSPTPQASHLLRDSDRVAAVYVPGQYISCAVPSPLPAYHIKGWHQPEDDFTWIDGIEGVLELTLRRPISSYTLKLDIVPNNAGGRLQTLEIFVNFFRMGFFEVDARMLLSLELPNEIFVMRKTRIVLHCRNAMKRSELGSKDTRRLGIAVCGWCIS